MICDYWFFNHGFKFQDHVCNDCHDLTMLCRNISNIAIITVKNIDYHCIISFYNINKSEAIHLLENSVVQDRAYLYKSMVLNLSLLKNLFLLVFVYQI